MNFFRKNANPAPTPLVDGLDGSELLGSTAEDTGAKPFQNAGGLEMTVMKPSGYADIAAVATEMLRNVTVVLNLEDVNKEECRRFLDFIGGVLFAIDGSIKKVAEATYIVTPRDVDVYDSSRITNRENIGDFDR